MTTENETLVRRFYDELCNGRQLQLAKELLGAEHVYHDPQIPDVRGPEAMADTVAAYQTGVNGHWHVEDLFSAGDNVVVRWHGRGTHVGAVLGLAPTGRAVDVEAISIHRIHDRQIAETWTVWDTLGFLQQLGALSGPGPG